MKSHRLNRPVKPIEVYMALAICIVIGVLAYYGALVWRLFYD